MGIIQIMNMKVIGTYQLLEHNCTALIALNNENKYTAFIKE